MTLYFLDCEMHCGGKLDGIWLWDSANVLEQVTRSLHLSPSAFLVGQCIRPGDMRGMVVGGGAGGVCFNNICLFTWLNWVSAAAEGASVFTVHPGSLIVAFEPLAVARGISPPGQGWHWGLLRWELGVVAPGAPGTSR